MGRKTCLFSVQFSACTALLLFLILQTEFIRLKSKNTSGFVSGFKVVYAAPENTCLTWFYNIIKLEKSQMQIIRDLKGPTFEPKTTEEGRAQDLHRFLGSYPLFPKAIAFLDNERQLASLRRSPLIRCLPPHHSTIPETPGMTATFLQAMRQVDETWNKLHPATPLKSFIGAYSNLLHDLHTYFRLAHTFQLFRLDFRVISARGNLDFQPLQVLRRDSCHTAFILNKLDHETETLERRQASFSTADAKLLKELIRTVEVQWYQLYVMPSNVSATLGCELGWDVVNSHLSISAKNKLNEYATALYQTQPCQGTAGHLVWPEASRTVKCFKSNLREFSSRMLNIFF